MLSLTLRRSRRLTRWPWPTPLYLPGAVVCAALIVETLLRGDRDLPGTLVLLIGLGACLLGLGQSIRQVGDLIVVQRVLGRTVIPLSQVAQFTIRPDERHAFRRLWIDLVDGRSVPTNVASGRGLFGPQIRLRFEQLVALVETLDAQRRAVTEDRDDTTAADTRG